MTEGSGAAGGLVAGILATFDNVRIISGIDLVGELVDLDK